MTSVWFRVAIVVGLVVWFAFADDIMRGLLQSAHQGDSIPVLSQLVDPGRYPLHRYYEQWDRMWLRASLTFLSLAGILFCVTSQRFRDWVDRIKPVPEGEGLALTFQGTQRVAFASAFFVLLVPQAFDMFIDREHWPYSNYTMYSGKQEPILEQFRVYGFDGEREIPLSMYFAPQGCPANGSSHLNSTLGIHYDRSLVGLDNMQDTADALAEWYERNRDAGIHNGPTVKSIRLYQVFFEMDVDASTIDTPSERVLLAESIYSTADVTNNESVAALHD